MTEERRSDATKTLTGAQALLSTLVSAGVEVIFANPGTSEMHAVAALDAVPGMRAVLALAEGVVTGAADGYGRITSRPAACLLHLGPGLANGVANLHNARRAHTPVVAVVGDHATYHKRLDAPLESDIDALAGVVSCWVRRAWRPADIGPATAAAVEAARRPPGGIATLILPADVSWSAGAAAGEPRPVAPPAPVGEEVLAEAAAVLRGGESTALLIGGPAAADPAAQDAAAAIAAATGATLLCETFPARLARGVGRPRLPRLAYLAEAATAQLAGHRHLLLIGAPRPVSFFAYPGRPGDLVPEGCAVLDLGGPGDDVVAALVELAGRLGASTVATPSLAGRPPPPEGALDAASVAAVVGSLLPEDAVVVDEAVTSSAGFGAALGASPPHDLLTLTGGAIGFGLPCATGAAVGAGGRPVVCLQADGSAMYTIQALWTQAREGLDVTTVIFDNRSYAILALELGRVEAGGAGPVARSLLDLDRPALDFASLAQGMGVPGSRATTTGELREQLTRALAEPGPHLIDAVIAGS